MCEHMSFMPVDLHDQIIEKYKATKSMSKIDEEED